MISPVPRIFCALVRGVVVGGDGAVLDLRPGMGKVNFDDPISGGAVRQADPRLFCAKASPHRR